MASLTVAILVLVALILIVYDIYVVVKTGFDATISWVIYSNAKLYPIIPFAMGVLCGHFFWSQVC